MRKKWKTKFVCLLLLNRTNKPSNLLFYQPQINTFYTNKKRGNIKLLKLILVNIFLVLSENWHLRQ